MIKKNERRPNLPDFPQKPTKIEPEEYFMGGTAISFTKTKLVNFTLNTFNSNDLTAK